MCEPHSSLSQGAHRWSSRLGTGRGRSWADHRQPAWRREPIKRYETSPALSDTLTMKQASQTSLSMFAVRSAWLERRAAGSAWCTRGSSSTGARKARASRPSPSLISGCVKRAPIVRIKRTGEWNRVRVCLSVKTVLPPSSNCNGRENGHRFPLLARHLLLSQRLFSSQMVVMVLE